MSAEAEKGRKLLEDPVLIYTRKGDWFLVDAADAEAVSWYTWYIDSDGYPATATGKGRLSGGSGQKIVRIHAFLLGPARERGGTEWDHFNRNKLDNRRSNLRLVTQAINQRNRGLSRKNTSGHKGIHRAASGKWIVQIGTDGRRKYVGTYGDLTEAIEARRAAEVACGWTPLAKLAEER